MDHVNIISKEAITTMMPEISNVIGCIALLVIAFLFGCLFYYSKKVKTKEAEKALIKVICFAGGIAIVLVSIIGIIGNIFFRVPTGRYKYEATIDEENMTVAEYNEFMKAYSHSYCKDGIYHFEDWIE
jgi:heme/copper-type cytochrome/quinol oxidase subunit 2